MSFKKELHDLMIKHNVDAIYWTCGELSDTQGLYNEQMVIAYADNTPQIEIDGYCISLSDLI